MRIIDIHSKSADEAAALRSQCDRLNASMFGEAIMLCWPD
jgi:hypothetical protein